MKKLRVIFIVPLMLLGAFLVPSMAHASTGVVSVNGGALVSAASTATTVSAPIQISNSNPINGFDIQIVANPTVIDGASVSLAGSVLSSPTIVLECIDGVLVIGTTCSPTDGLGVVHLAASGAFGSLTGNPTTGLLFTINYNILGSSAGTPISFQTGCTNTSVAGDCVTVANGTPTAVPETDQGSTFANLIDFSMTPAHTALSTPSGVAISDLITYTAEGGYSDLVTETCVAPAGDTCTFATGSVDFSIPANPRTQTDTVTVTGSASGSVSVTAMGGTFVPPNPLRSHTPTIALTIAPAGFTVSLGQSTIAISQGGTGTTSVTLNGVSGFSGAVTFTASGTNGITGSAPSATLTNDGSGFSTASSTLTISVPSGGSGGMLTLTGMSGATSASATIAVTVNTVDFLVVASPNAITIVRGGSVALNVNIFSEGNFAGTGTLSAAVSPVAGQQDSCCLTNNISPAFSSSTATLTAGGSVSISFFASTVGGTAPASTYTSTGNYTATISVTFAGVTHTALVTFNIEDFTVGPGFCNDLTFSNGVYTSPNANNFPVFVTNQCSSLTITDQPNIVPAASNLQVLWVQTLALGGLITDGFNGTPAIAALNTELPPNGVTVPQLASDVAPGPSNMCLLPTFWANGTQIPYSYLEANGPVVSPGDGLYAFLAQIGAVPPGFSNWGCKFDAGAFPNDHGIGELNNFFLTTCDKDAAGHCSDSDAAKDIQQTCTRDASGNCIPGTGSFDTNECAESGCPYPTVDNPDFWAVTAMALQGTLAGKYTFQLCGQSGVLRHCQMFGLNIVHAPVVHQLVVKKSVSFAASGGNLAFKMGISNVDPTFTLYAQVTVTAVGSLGDSITTTSAVVAISPNANANNIALSVPLLSSYVGESFTFSFSIAVGTDPANLDGVSTLQTIQQTVTVLV